MNFLLCVSNASIPHCIAQVHRFFTEENLPCMYRVMVYIVLKLANFCKLTCLKTIIIVHLDHGTDVAMHGVVHNVHVSME